MTEIKKGICFNCGAPLTLETSSGYCSKDCVEEAFFKDGQEDVEMSDIKISEFVQQWIDTYEPGTFVKSKTPSKGYWYVSEDGQTGLNLSIFFEDLLEYFIEHQKES